MPQTGLKRHSRSGVYPLLTGILSKAPAHFACAYGGEPWFLPTRMPQVYVNAFVPSEAEGSPPIRKAVYTIYNARHEAVNGDLLALATIPRAHFVDLLRGQELAARIEGDQTILPIGANVSSARPGNSMIPRWS